jgi:D-glycero-alpha-D-manno-heptose-7-phosphate kinase
MLIVRSPVRISFAGGGTDLPAYFEQFDGVVLSAAINKYFYTVLQKRDDGKIQVISSDLRVCETWEDISRLKTDDSTVSIPLAVLKECGFHHLSVDLFLASEIPPGTGLGSSASVCVNVLKTITTYLHIPLAPTDLAERAYHIARNIMRKPVGKQDEYASAFGGLNLIHFLRSGKTQVQPVSLNGALLEELQGNLMLFFTGASHDSWRILKDQEKNSSEKTGTALEYLHRIKDLAYESHDLLTRGELYAFGKTLHRGWEQKRMISEHISTPRIDLLYRTALEAGAVGGKITGAGGGGFLLLYCERKNQPAVRAAFAAEGINEMHFQFDFNGAHAVANDPFVDGDQRAGSRWVYVAKP